MVNFCVKSIKDKVNVTPPLGPVQALVLIIPLDGTNGDKPSNGGKTTVPALARGCHLNLFQVLERTAAFRG